MLWLRVTFCPRTAPSAQPGTAPDLPRPAQPPEGNLLLPSPATSPPSCVPLSHHNLTDQVAKSASWTSLPPSLSPPLPGLTKPRAKPSGGRGPPPLCREEPKRRAEAFPFGATSQKARSFRRGGGRGAADMVRAGAGGYGSRGRGARGRAAGCKRRSRGRT